MKVLNLRCGQQHDFEGWFASEDDFQHQLKRALVACPMCGDASIVKMPCAPRLHLASSPSSRSEDLAASATGSCDEQLVSTMPKALQKAWLLAARQLLAQTEDVGERFAQEARRMHYGEAQERAIRGQASQQETQELREEGIDVQSLPLPQLLKQTLQ